MPVAPCLVMAVSKVAGEIVIPSDTLPADCSTARPGAELRYDAGAKVVRARRDLASGTPLGHVFIPQRPAVIPGDRVMITARIGHVTIARPALALQAADAGHRYFVKMGDGRIVAVPAVSKGEAN